ncbi:hypothetical protein [Streptomyces sp. NPDC089919]|uniref:hypothetical protein n=1 Tax=Streptomyces sp. NPDC089919 TaxID=3155188 RepID=UPI003424DCA7
MRRGLVHGAAWTLATGASVTLSWWGVHTVMAGTAYDPPRALPLTAQTLSSSTYRPAPPPSPSAPAPRTSPPATRPASPAPSKGSDGRTERDVPPDTGTDADADAGTVKSYTVDGGRVAFDLGARSARLVSATPADGWRMQVWKQPTWIRVAFTRDGHEVSVFCTWHDHPPLVETYTQ